MSTPSRRPALGTSQTPTTPNSTPNEPKSEYLRHALDARRAKQETLSPVPTETKPPKSATPSNASSDPWLDHAKSEEDLAPAPPIRRPRRPSEGAMPRMRTQREQQAESEALKDVLFSLNLKLELARKQNNELKDAIEEANSRIAELEPFEDENIELQEVNHDLTIKNEDLTDENIQLRDHNAEILRIQDEAVMEMGKLHTSLEEAAEWILRLEKEKAVVAEENTQLKDQVAVLQTTSSAVTHNGSIDGAARDRGVPRVYSIDESRPSTSHFDSDYYSQPASPNVKASKESVVSLGISERTKNFLAMSKEGKQSVQDLKKRLSTASLRQVKHKSSIPDVPQIPEPYLESQATKSIKPSKRYRRVEPLSPALQVDPTSAVNPASSPRTPTGQTQGLRGLFQSNMNLNDSYRESRTMPRSSRSRQHHSGIDGSPSTHSEATRPTPPPRESSRQAHTTRSHEQLQQGARTGTETETDTQTEWAEMPPPPSLISEDLTTELEANGRDQWWKSIDRVTTGRTGAIFGPESATPRSSGLRGLAGPHPQRDLLFNGAEDEDQFIRRVQKHGSGRRDR